MVSNLRLEHGAWCMVHGASLMQDARCKMQDARCKMQDARCNQPLCTNILLSNFIVFTFLFFSIFIYYCTYIFVVFYYIICEKKNKFLRLMRFKIMTFYSVKPIPPCFLIHMHLLPAFTCISCICLCTLGFAVKSKI